MIARLHTIHSEADAFERLIAESWRAVESGVGRDSQQALSYHRILRALFYDEAARRYRLEELFDRFAVRLKWRLDDYLRIGSANARGMLTPSEYRGFCQLRDQLDAARRARTQPGSFAAKTAFGSFTAFACGKAMFGSLSMTTDDVALPTIDQIDGSAEQ